MDRLGDLKQKSMEAKHRDNASHRSSPWTTSALSSSLLPSQQPVRVFEPGFDSKAFATAAASEHLRKNRDDKDSKDDKDGKIKDDKDSKGERKNKGDKDGPSEHKVKVDQDDKSGYKVQDKSEHKVQDEDKHTHSKPKDDGKKENKGERKTVWMQI